MSKWYNIEVINIMVHRWDNEKGEGDCICCKGGFTMGSEPTIEKARQHINEFFGYKIDDQSIDGSLIMANQIENEDGYQDNDGSYIADYYIEVHCVEAVAINA